ncbi:hypothetical protein N8577_03610 [Akkermansiaceae bacterium]|nr:hypothetical protein [Akkermansiaceae bacterium]MDB4367824.1 hypothetical protein [Akkermansiaceae bacterium]MDB4398206.1 hypothetical protein [Akkermansiaceae bacterium]MDB4780109.1 hypothetical protein [Akkermansiaceae bacterium]
MWYSPTVHTNDTHRHNILIVNQIKSKLKTGKITVMILLLIFVAATWLGRGLYDKLFMLEGQVFVVNATAEDHTIKLTFPLGEELKVNLKAGDSSRCVIGKTGEGSIDVTIDGTGKDDVGYLTTKNGMMILTIAEDSVIFSQFSP